MRNVGVRAACEQEPQQLGFFCALGLGTTGNLELVCNVGFIGSSFCGHLEQVEYRGFWGKYMFQKQRAVCMRCMDSL